jgi:hypothetical protein
MTDPTAGLQFGSVVDFVTDVVAKVYRRKLKDVGNATVWCPEWWRHPEAVMRLDGLWMAWEVLRAAPDGMSAWFRDHADVHMAVLLDERGPFRECKNQKHQERLPELPLVPPPGKKPRAGTRMKPVDQQPPTKELSRDEEIAGLESTCEAQAATIEELQGSVELLRARVLELGG